MSDRPISRPANNPEWDDAWDIIRRLSVARHRLSNEAVHDQASAAAERASPIPSSPRSTNGVTTLAVPTGGETALDPDELARAIADIERASAALRRAEPALESGFERNAPQAQLSGPRSVWVLIGVLWISTVLVTAGVIFSIATLVG
jgi:hypothetical protein